MTAAGERPLDPDPCPPKTRSDLEWDRVLDALVMRCSGAAGKALARALPFARTRGEILRSLAEVREAQEREAAGEPLPLRDLPDVSAALERAAIGATLANEEIRSVALCLGSARVLRRYLQTRRDLVPNLYEACATDPTLDTLERDLAGSFDPDGTLADHASPRLAELRSESRACRARLVRKLEEMLRKHDGILQDGYWTERDGRYVLPVRADSHERFPGIVHGASDSGSTLFVEPRAIVEMGNRQKMLDAETQREEHAIYVALSARVAEAAVGLADADRALAHADVRNASARLAKELDLAYPEVPVRADGDRASPPGSRGFEGESEGRARIDLIAARHPLLVLDGVAVVPSDLAIEAGRAMIVSGPNAGGKTVALKALGLAALMLRAGLPVPAAAGSSVAAFDRVLTDVGDDQNLRKNLSTFSAHIQNLAGILDATHPGVLVLLDELAGGTDPREGEALAAAILDSLCARGGATGCTTHYDGLKALALGDARFENASVGFDLATMSPTFRLAIGVPGSSSALSVARRFGVPGTVIERAERFLTKESVSFDKMVERLADERRALELSRADAERERDLAREMQRDLADSKARLADKDKRAVESESASLLASLKHARAQLREAETLLRKRKPDEAELRLASKAIESVAKKVAIGGELAIEKGDAAPTETLSASDVRLGLRVYVPRLRVEAEIVEILEGGKLRVAAGPLKLVTQLSDVRVALGKAKAAKGSALVRRAPYDAAADAEAPMQTSENTVDLRGLRAHEAIAMAEQFLDRSMGAGRRVAFLIHGHGTGALRLSLREALGASAYIERMRPGGPGEGGDGVTVAWLR